MERLVNQMKIQAAMQQGKRVSTRMGLVDSYDPSTHSCKVRLQPEDPTNPAASLTGWLPIGIVGTGTGFGVLVGLERDHMVMVYFIDDNLECGIVGPSIIGGVAQPPAVPSGECWLTHKSGIHIKLTNDGTIESNGEWNHIGDLNLDGSVVCTGDVSDSKGSMDIMRGQHNIHTHTGDGPSVPPGSTSPPITGGMI